jgi:hypothetical protein
LEVKAPSLNTGSYKNRFWWFAIGTFIPVDSSARLKSLTMRSLSAGCGVNGK